MAITIEATLSPSARRRRAVAVEPDAANDTVANTPWGRRKEVPRYLSTAAALFTLACPTWMMLNWLALEHHHGSLADAVQAALSQPWADLVACLPRPTRTATLGYAAWVLFQALLFVCLPGQKCHGQQTPGGHTLAYTANGLTAWIVTHLLFLAACVLGLVDPAVIAKNWEGLLVAANVYGFLLAAFVQVKGYLYPSFPRDRKLSNAYTYDFWAGVELNPRIGERFDMKFFHNCRPGMVAWTLIDISWAAYQYQTHGQVTTSMLIVLALHTVYTVDLFYNESWYTRTIDITHDHFGFMLAWGDTTFLPATYTLQAQYLARHPTALTTFQSLAVLATGLASYAIFRSANHQKDLVRSTGGLATVWGRPAQFLRARYVTEDGRDHQSLLLTSGWWGQARHANYLADLVQSWAMCAGCGFGHLLPWTYFVFMCVLLWHRARRDDRRCRAKYGDTWEEYCRLVRWKIVPGIY